MRKNTKYISINNYQKLLDKLKDNNLLKSNGLPKEIKEYCKKGTYDKTNYLLSTVYTGLLIKELNSLNNYEIAILMIGKDTFSYDVFRGKNGYFKVIEYKNRMKRSARCSNY